MPQNGEDDALAAALGVEPAAWDGLALAGGSIFQSREWLSTWWRHHQRDLPLVSLTDVDGDGRLRAMLPLVRVRSRPAVLRPLGQWPPAVVSIVGDRADWETSGPVLAEQLGRLPGWDLLQASAVPLALPFDPGQRGGYAHTREPDRLARLGGLPWEEYVFTRSRNFRQQISKRERVLQRDHRVVYRRADDPGRLRDDVQELLRLHRLRWPDSAVLTPASEEFHHEIVRESLERGWLAFWFLELDGVAVAAALNFRYGGNETFYQVGRDPAYEREGVGVALVAHTMAAAADAGIQEFHFLRGSEEYKRRLADDDSPVQNHLFAGSVLGAAAVGAFAGRRVLPHSPATAVRRLAPALRGRQRSSAAGTGSVDHGG